MPTHIGSFNQEQFGLLNSPGSTNEPLSTQFYESFRESSFCGVYSQNAPTRNPENHNAFLDTSETPKTQLLDRIYFFPIDQNCEHRFDLGLITSEVENFFQIWNAFSVFKTVDPITPINPDGTILNTPATPFFISGNNKDQYSVTVTEEGPTDQNTSYLFTINGSVFELIITAQRLQELDRIFKPNWKTPTKFSYEFETVVFRNRVNKEQRRPLFESSKITQQSEFLVDEDDFENAHHVLKRSHSKTFFIPIYHEIMIPVNTVLFGATVLEIDPDDDISKLWNLVNRTDFLQVSDKHDPTLSEVVAIDSFNFPSNEINITSPISLNFNSNKGRTIVSPVFKARITNFEPKYEGARIATFSLNFEEPRGQN